ncbi:hypothetical protein Y032_0352g3271 [Ancylostoma ceylanicum]|uniref:Uncharacterized protein n=1 Tax=Ancylostoma ceylanicum TaxID=53326 RepID=A0A016RWI4_9BILA|nr:hypothetical protein Y032_0352g3271 [Ancylostoma ceylanicum]
MIQNYDCDVEKIADDLLKAISEQQWWPYDVFVYTGDSEKDVKQKALDSLKEVTPKFKPSLIADGGIRPPVRLQLKNRGWQEQDSMSFQSFLRLFIECRNQ